MYLSNNTVFQTIVFPTSVVYPDSYVQDMRFDLRPELSQSGKGIAYLTDSSINNINGLLVVDLGTEEVWRHFDTPSVGAVEPQFNAYIWGTPLLYATPATSYLPVGRRLTLSADGSELFFGVAESRYLYSVPTSFLRDRGPASELCAQGAIRNRGQKGISDGYEVDTNGLIYLGNVEQNAINIYNPANGTATVYVRDPRINWPDTRTSTLVVLLTAFLSLNYTSPCLILPCIAPSVVTLLMGYMTLVTIGDDGYLYFTLNQLQLTPFIFPGTDRRVRPFGLMRVKLVGNGARVKLI